MAKQNKNVPEIILSERHIMHYLPASTQLVYWKQQQQIKNNVAKFHQVWSGEDEMTVCAAELKQWLSAFIRKSFFSPSLVATSLH